MEEQVRPRRQSFRAKPANNKKSHRQKWAIKAIKAGDAKKRKSHAGKFNKQKFIKASKGQAGQ